MLMLKLIELSEYLGIPTAPENSEVLCSSFRFIGLGIDSVSRNIFSPMNTVIEMIDNPHYV